VAIEEYWCAGEDDLRDNWDAAIADGLDLDDPEPDFEAGDTVCFKDWPDFTYEVMGAEGEATLVECGGWGHTKLPTAALRKVQASIEQVTEALADVNQRLRDQ
jgi:hypothetical protein